MASTIIEKRKKKTIKELVMTFKLIVLSLSELLAISLSCS